MRVFLCGEGPHDVGEKIWNKKKGEWVYCEGWMQPIVRKLLGDHVQFLPATRKDLTLLPRENARLRPMPPGHGARALLAAIKAKVEKCDLAVFMADADSADIREWRLKRAEIQEGFDRVSDEIKTAACLPMAASECWLLADEGAWSAICAERGAADLPPRPEECWGERNDPLGNHPKHVFARVCEAAECADGREVRRVIAEQTDGPTLVRVCPISFGDFYNTLKNLTGESSPPAD